ncbi:MAG: hypothetical protein AAGG06_08755 [Pseudomonadota bacterium]
MEATSFADSQIPIDAEPILTPALPRTHSSTVRRRKVLYIAGFDPIGPRRYRELYRREATRSEHPISVEPLPIGPGRSFRWGAHWHDGHNRVSTEIEFLGWDDLVRDGLTRGILPIYRRMLATLGLYIGSGAFRAMRRLHRGPRIAAVGALGMMLFYLAYAGLAAGAAFLLATGPAAAPWPLGLVAAMLAFAGSMAATRLIETQVMVYFLVNDLSFMAAEGGAYPDRLDRRLDGFAERLRRLLADSDWDEVLLVGHSSGAQLAVSTAARAMGGAGAEARLSVLTLGQSIPMTSFLPGAGKLRAELAALADDARVTWLDVSAPADGACFALCDPAAVSRTAGRPGASPLVISAGFRRSMTPAAFAQARWRLMRRHFQYLCHALPDAPFDWFAVSAGPVRLAKRYAETRPSPSLFAEPVAPILHDG